jgi:hypothetical protein
VREPNFCNEWDCPNNQNGECYVNDDECPSIQECFEKIRKGVSNNER